MLCKELTSPCIPYFDSKLFLLFLQFETSKFTKHTLFLKVVKGKVRHFAQLSATKPNSHIHSRVTVVSSNFTYHMQQDTFMSL